jgi:hypothetical protein
MSKRFRDDAVDNGDVAGSNEIHNPKKAKPSVQFAGAVDMSIPTCDPTERRPFEDDDEENDQRDSDIDEEDTEFDKKMSKLQKKGLNRDKELMYTARLQAQGISLDDEEEEQPAPTRPNLMADMDKEEDIFAEPAPKSDSAADEEDDVDEYSKVVREKFKAVAAAPGKALASSGITVDDADYLERKKRLLASFEDRCTYYSTIYSRYKAPTSHNNSPYPSLPPQRASSPRTCAASSTRTVTPSAGRSTTTTRGWRAWHAPPRPRARRS